MTTSGALGHSLPEPQAQPVDDNPHTEKLAQAQHCLQQAMALRDDHPGDPFYENLITQYAADLSDVAYLHAQAAAPYIHSFADTSFYGDSPFGHF